MHGVRVPMSQTQSVSCSLQMSKRSDVQRSLISVGYYFLTMLSVQFNAIRLPFDQRQNTRYTDMLFAPSVALALPQ